MCIKDLQKIGRPLSRTIIVDNLAENFSRQPRNGIEIGTWKYNPYDTQLKVLASELAKIVTHPEQPRDVRVDTRFINLLHESS